MKRSHAPMNAEVVGIEEEIVVFVFADESKAVVLLHTDIDERLVNRAAYVLR
jgi:hypothetical protein